MRYGFVYMIRNKINGKVYIGQTTRTSFGGRYSSGKWWTQTHNEHLKKSANKYGFENFEVKILLDCFSKQELDEQEKNFILAFNSLDPQKGYNKTVFGLCDEELSVADAMLNKQKISERMKAMHQDPIHRAFIIELLQKNRSDPSWKNKVREGIQKYHEENKIVFAQKNSRAWSPERREKARQKMIIRNQDPDFKQKVIENGKKVQARQDSIEKRIKNFEAYNKDPQIIEQKRALMLSRNSDPGYQAKCQDAKRKKKRTVGETA